MRDLYIGIAIMVSVSGLFFAFTFIISSKFPRRIADWFAVLTMVLMCLYVYYLWDKAEVTWLVPYSNAVIVGNWFPIFTAVLSALVYHRVPPGSQRKFWIVILLNLVGIYALIQPMMGSVPDCKDVRDDNFKWALQTSQVSCSPTSAVNLLGRYEIDSTESEMSDLCLTRKSRVWMGLRFSEGGTSWMGLYRGLKIKLADSRLEPRFFIMDFETFIQNPTGSPLICSLKLDPNLEETDPDKFEFLKSGGWQPGVEHNVVYIMVENGRVGVVDPKVGYEEMDVEVFRSLWVGRGIYLEAH